MRYFLLGCTLLLSSGCQPTYLNLYTEAIGREQLASYHVHTPDPALIRPEIGQRLILDWKLPNAFFYRPNLHIKVTVRFRNGFEEVLDYPITTKQQTYLIEYVGTRYLQTGGIATYRAELLSGLLLLTEWQHQLWNTTIEVPINE